MSDKYRSGDWYLTCANTGWKIRRSDAVLQWDGAWVHRDHCDLRNPLDLPAKASKARPVYPVRPEPSDSFVSLAGIDVDDVVITFTITAEAGAYHITGTDVTLSLTGITVKLDFSIATNSQYVPLVFCNWI